MEASQVAGWARGCRNGGTLETAAACRFLVGCVETDGPLAICSKEEGGRDITSPSAFHLASTVPRRRQTSTDLGTARRPSPTYRIRSCSIVPSKGRPLLLSIQQLKGRARTIRLSPNNPRPCLSPRSNKGKAKGSTCITILSFVFLSLASRHRQQNTTSTPASHTHLPAFFGRSDPAQAFFCALLLLLLPTLAFLLLLPLSRYNFFNRPSSARLLEHPPSLKWYKKRHGGKPPLSLSLSCCGPT